MLSETQFQKYFGQLINIHKNNYPMPRTELKIIIEASMAGFGIIAEGLERGRNEFTPQEQPGLDGFLFYYNSLKNSNVSPITVKSGLKKDLDKKLGLFTYYIGDISSSEGGNGNWAGWKFPENLAPWLHSSNLWIYFIARKRSRESLEKYIKESLIEEHKDRLIEKLENGNLLRGDLHFGLSQLKSFLSMANHYSSYTKLPAQDIERAKVELGDRNVLRYVNLQGEEIVCGKTTFEAWEEFQIENPKLFEGLVKGFASGNQPTPELQVLLNNAFTLLRLKGFSKYPDLSA